VRRCTVSIKGKDGVRTIALTIIYPEHTWLRPVGSNRKNTEIEHFKQS
jgi:hypothetical protein